MNFYTLVRAVTECGSEALGLQKGIKREYKDDGSIITEADQRINDILIRTIGAISPESFIISEESETDVPTPDKNLCFVLDPIDGTDAYSQGFPGWCIAVGILGPGFLPVGAVIYAPRWPTLTEAETLITLEPGERAECNGRQMDIYSGDDSESKRKQIMVSSRIHRKVNFYRFPGKVRTAGSAVLHLVSPLLYPEITASVQASCYIWDMAAAHAVLYSCGYNLEYLSGGAPDYGKLIKRVKTDGIILSGKPADLEKIKNYISLREERQQY